MAATEREGTVARGRLAAERDLVDLGHAPGVAATVAPQAQSVRRVGRRLAAYVSDERWHGALLWSLASSREPLLTQHRQDPAVEEDLVVCLEDLALGPEFEL